MDDNEWLEHGYGIERAPTPPFVRRFCDYSIDPTPDPLGVDERYEINELFGLARRTIGELGWYVLSMHYVEGRSLAEIGKELRLSLTSVEKLERGAISRVRSLVDRLFPQEERWRDLRSRDN